jgi:hypothetical protein
VNDWGKELIEYIEEPSRTVDRKVQRQSIKYTIMDGALYRRTIDGLLLKCLSEEEA